MKYTAVGDTGIELPPVIFGTSALGNLYAEPSAATKLAIVENCLTLMPSTPVVFDSAGKYGAGMALEVLGHCLDALNTQREDVLISNKLGWYQTALTGTEPTFERGVWYNLKHDAVQRISYQGILDCWKQGNELLGGKYIPDLVSVHDPDEFIEAATDAKQRDDQFAAVLDAYRALIDLKKEGKVKAVGVGAKNWKIIEQLAREVDLDWIMIANSYTIYDHPPELSEFMDRMQKKGVFIINSAVFNAGFLVGGSYFNYKRIESSDPDYAEHFRWREKFFARCNTYNISPSHACIQFGLSHPAVSAIALNTSKPGNVEKNIREVSTPVTEDFFKEMQKEGLL